MDVRGQVPFFRLLIPIIGGILFVYYISYSNSLLLIGIIGVILIIFSFFKSKKTNYSLRWMFGAGLMLSLFFFSTLYYKHFTEISSYTFDQEERSYIGEVLDLPQQKKRSIAIEVQMNYPVNKKTLIYLEPDVRSQQLQPGDLIVIKAIIKPFENLGNPNEFDYKKFMRRKGFSGSAFVGSEGWINTGKTTNSIKSKALRTRAMVLTIYKNFGLNNDEYAFLSALTLGYKADLSNALKQSFRATGTSHVLAVSGLHVGIVYFIIGSLFFFLKGKSKIFILKQVVVLLALWTYVFFTGMPVSVIRAAIMLTLFSIGSMFHKKGYSYNTLLVAAFFLLIINPLYLFDVGFQLSFISVFSIMFFQPKLFNLYKPKYKVSQYFWGLMTVSIAAQLGVLPLSLYYFGTFPTYFFITNILILPLIGIVIYFAFILSVLSICDLSILVLAQKLLGNLLQSLINIILRIIYFFESLPFSIIDDYHITIIQVFIIFTGLFSLSFFITNKRASLLITFLSSISLLFVTNAFTYLNKPENQFVIYNNYTESNMGYILNGREIACEVMSNKVIAHPKASILLLSNNEYKSKISGTSLSVDFLILSSDNSFSMNELINHFNPKTVITDSSLSPYVVEKIKRECNKLNITFHDISNSGAYSIKF